MKKRLLAILCSLFAAVFLLSLFSYAAEDNPPPEITCTSAAVCNLESDKILYDKNLTGRISPAPFTKLMTALLALEYREKVGNVNVTVTEEMLSSSAGLTMKLKAGEIIPLDSLLEGLIVYNANDAALVLASVSGGNVASFVEAMNLRAAELGMANTHYTNPMGTHSSAMYTTMEDTLLLCKALYRVNRFMVLSEQSSVTIPATNLTGERQYTNRNALIPFSYVTDYYMKGVRGMIAGYTGEAGWCVATVRQKDNATYLVVLSGGVDRSEEQNQMDISSYREAKALLEWAEEGFAFQTVLPKGKVICEKKVRLGSGIDHVVLATGEEVKALLPVSFNEETDVTYEIHADKDVFTAPIIEGSSYGSIDIIYNGEILATIPLVAQASVGLSRWLVTWDAILSFFSHGPAKAALYVAIFAAVAYVGILVGTVWIHHHNQTKEKRKLISEMHREEDQRLKLVRQEEKKASRARFRRVTRALHEGFLVLSGEADDGTPSTTPRRGVARVPEKYRKNPPPQSTPQRKRPPQRTAQRSQHPGPTAQKGKPVIRSTPQKLSRPGNVGSGKKVPLKGEKVTISRRPNGAPPRSPSRPNPYGKPVKKNGPQKGQTKQK